MDIPALEHWYAAYLDDFRALARGETDDPAALVRHYASPLLLVTGAGTTVLADPVQAGAHLRPQVAALRADGYDRSDLLESETTVLNGVCATHRARVARVRTDGSQIARLQATYLVTLGPDGHRIAAMVAHSDAD